MWWVSEIGNDYGFCCFFLRNNQSLSPPPKAGDHLKEGVDGSVSPLN